MNYSSTAQSGEPLRSKGALIAFSAIDSVAACLLAWFLYSKLYYRLPMFVVIGAIFALAYLILSVAVICWYGGKSAGVGRMLLVLPMAALIFALSAFLQWAYSLDPSDFDLAPREYMASSYVFIIDDSGSTAITDPDGYRYAAVSGVMRDMADDVPYAVYSFADETVCLRKMAPKGDGEDLAAAESYGGTNMRAALRQALTDHKNGEWGSAKNPEVVLITDGYANDFSNLSPLHVVLNDFVAAGIPVSTVGFDACDRELLVRIAESTGGVFADASDASGLFDAARYVEESPVRKVTESRNLLSFRFSEENNILYAVERIVFLTLLSTLILRLAVLPCVSHEAPYYAAPLNYIRIAVCSVLFEVGIKFLPLPLLVFWLPFFAVCFGFVLLKEYAED